MGGCQGGWERRIEAFVKIQSGRGGGVRVDVNREVKFLSKFKKKFEGGGGSGRVGVGGGGGGSDQGLGWGRWGSKVWGRWVMWGMGDVNQE